MGRDSLKIEPRSGGPATFTIEEKVDRVHHMVMDVRRLSINQISNAICISREEVENILLSGLGKTKVSAQWVSHLTPYQKLTRPITSRENLTAGFLERLLTPNE
ncbi:uncharacterized protein LOC115228284 [Octopus sinensis]|uniref:Uncharacterized protein LOC115228284 n=1 Tax=Octopus sinensis TaxID=2607531 RepID=A0A6P7TR96_9MOLL|nr:uncharacterized protein LOC115228284 [Octopus sinensis]